MMTDFLNFDEYSELEQQLEGCLLKSLSNWDVFSHILVGEES